MKKIVLVFGIIAALSSLSLYAATVEIKATAVEKEGKKYWLPETITVHKGDTVKLTLENTINSKAGNTHGFEIPDYKISEVVEFGKSKTVEFKADKAGTFATKCQLHPAHIGNKLIVL